MKISNNNNYSEVDFENSVIELSDTDGTEHQKRCLILWHEILHGIIEATGIEVSEEEKVVDVLSKGIYQVLQDNGARFFDISPGEYSPEEIAELLGIFVVAVMQQISDTGKL